MSADQPGSSSPPTSSPLSNHTPLSQVDPQSLDIYFAKHPEDLSDEEVALIVERLSADRLKFMANPEAEPAKSRASAVGKKIDAPEGISSADLLKKIGL